MTRTGSKTIIAELTRTKADVEALLKAEIAAHERTKADAIKANRACGSQTCGQIADDVLSGKVNTARLRAIAARVPLWRELERLARDQDRESAMEDVLRKLATLDGKVPHE